MTQAYQFSLGNIPTMSGITDSIGEGWDDRKIAIFFNKRNNIVNGQEEVPMTRSTQFGTCIHHLVNDDKNKIDDNKRQRKFIHH